jgi:hypothetical protein
VLAAAPGVAASPAEAQVDPQPDYVRTHPGGEELVFMRANDAVTYRWCVPGTAHCGEVTVTCAEAREDTRAVLESAEQARRLLTAAGVYRIIHLDLDRVQRTEVRVAHYLERLKEAGVLPLRFAFINSAIDGTGNSAIRLGGPESPDDEPQDLATYRDPTVTELLEELFGPAGDVDSWIAAVDGLDDLARESTDDDRARRSIAAYLPIKARATLAELNDDAVNGVLDATEEAEFLEEVREALEVSLPDLVLKALDYIEGRLRGSTRGLYGFGKGLTSFDTPYLAPSELLFELAGVSTWHVYFDGLLEFLGLRAPVMRHVGALEVGDGDGNSQRIPASGVAVGLESLCRRHTLPDDDALDFVDGAGREVVEVGRAFASIAPVRNSRGEWVSEELAGVPLRSAIVKSSDGSALLQDGDNGWYRVEDWFFEDYDVYVPNPGGGNPLRRRVASYSLRLDQDGLTGDWNVLDWVDLDENGAAEAAVVRTYPAAEVEAAVPVDVTRIHNGGSGPTGSIHAGGGISVRARGVLGEAQVEYCLISPNNKRCPRPGRLTVLVEPEGWDDARADAADDDFRVLVNRVTGRIVLLQSLADGAPAARGEEVVTVGAEPHAVVDRLCCLPEDYHWSVDLVLPVMRNDGVRFLRDGTPLNKGGSKVAPGELDPGDLARCDGGRYCSYLRPRPLSRPRQAGRFDADALPDLQVERHARSLELRLSADPESAAAAGGESYTEGAYTFEYCLAHRDGRCGRPRPCTRVTYLDEPRAPNAAPLAGVASLAEVDVGFFEVTRGCRGTGATVKVTVEVHVEGSLDAVPAQVWEQEPDGDPPPPEDEKYCYQPKIRGDGSVDYGRAGADPWHSTWTLDPVDGRAPPEWCFLTLRKYLDRAGHCVLTVKTSNWRLGAVEQSPQSRWQLDWHGQPSRSTAGLRPVFLTGHRLIEGDPTYCRGERQPRIVGVWGTHVGAENWRFLADNPAGKDEDCDFQPVYPQEASCNHFGDFHNDNRRFDLDGFVPLDRVLNHRKTDPRNLHDLGEAWHDRLAAVEPCIGERECDEWVPPVPGWYQVRVEVDTHPATHRRSACPKKTEQECRDPRRESSTPFCPTGTVPEGKPAAGDEYKAYNRKLDGDDEYWWYCYTQAPDPDGDGPERAPPPVPLMSEPVRFVFDELIWVDAPYLGP